MNPFIASLEESAPASARRAASLLFLLLGAACVWVDGNPEIAAPRIEDHEFSSLPPPVPPIAWSAGTAPPAEEQRVAALREAARLDRAKSPLLVAAERAECQGLSDDDRDVSPFFHVRDVVDVEPLRAPAGTTPGRLEGAMVIFRRIEGLTAARLQRMTDCQSARDVALGYAAPEIQWCPLAVRGVVAHVEPDERGLRVLLSATGPDGAVETYGRAMALLDAR
jgi:hypothetical protein